MVEGWDAMSSSGGGRGVHLQCKAAARSTRSEVEMLSLTGVVVFVICVCMSACVSV